MRGQDSCDPPLRSTGLNGGQLLVTNATLASRIHNLRPRIPVPSNYGLLDQDRR